MEAMREIHGERHKRSYGSPRMQRELVAQGHRVSENTVARLMRQSGLRATTARKFRHTTDSNHRLPVAQNVLDRQFEASGPNEKWVSDITYVWTAEGWLYLAAVEDLYTRKVVGWSLGERLTSELVNEALRMGIGRQLPTVDLTGAFGPWQPICQRELSTAAGVAWDQVQHEPQGELLGQRADGEFFCDAEEGVGPPGAVRHARGSAAEPVRVHRSVLQPGAEAFGDRLPESDEVRGSGLMLPPTSPTKATRLRRRVACTEQPLTGGRINMFQQGERKPMHGWLQGPFTARLLDVLVEKLAGERRADSGEGIEVVIDFKRQRKSDTDADEAIRQWLDGHMNKEIAKNLERVSGYVTRLLKLGAQRLGTTVEALRSQRKTRPAEPSKISRQANQRRSDGLVVGRVVPCWDRRRSPRLQHRDCRGRQ